MTVVLITRDRAPELAHTLGRLLALPEQPPVVVVDNGSRDGTPAMVAERFPAVRLLQPGRNLGAAGRNLGVAAATTPLVAFSDDDSWWAPGALRLAAERFEGHPRLALLAARVLVGAAERDDPLNAALRASPLPPEPDLPGPPVLGFLACAAVVRRAAFQQAGGFHPCFGVGGEEALLAMDLAVAGWGLAYDGGLVAHHHPSASRDPAGRTRTLVRNALWLAALRRPWRAAGSVFVRELRRGLRNPDARAGVGAALRGGAWVLRERRPIPAAIEQRLRALEAARRE